MLLAFGLDLSLGVGLIYPYIGLHRFALPFFTPASLRFAYVAAEVLVVSCTLDRTFLSCVYIIA